MEGTKKRTSRRERSRSRGKSPSNRPRRVAKSSSEDVAELVPQQSASGEQLPRSAATCTAESESMASSCTQSAHSRPDKDVRWMSKLETRPDNPEKKVIREKLRARPSSKNETADRSRAKGPMVAIPPSGAKSSASSRSTSSSQSEASVQNQQQRPNSLRTWRSPSPRGRQDSPFTRQVVNTSRTNSPTSPRLPRHRVSPSNSRSGSPTSFLLRRSPSPQNGDPNLILAENVLRKRVERALHARLYLLQQDGPNSFVIGGDSPDHKYKVTIGAQNCNCGRGPYCLHLLFVMLRVFQVKETDAMLWCRTLKNYEVETLFRRYQSRQKTRLKQKPESDNNAKLRRPSSDESSTPDDTSRSKSPATNSATSSLSSDQSKEEDLCPICLLEMVEGESLVVCKEGCHNRLHHHCVAIWATECQRQGEQLICPLCRTKWQETTPSDEITDSNRATTVPNNTRASSPVRTAEGDGDVQTTMPTQAQRWTEVFGEELIQFLFSREWTERENALHQLRPSIRLKLVGHDRHDRHHRISSDSDTVLDKADRLQVIECVCGILVSTCSDPVYNVYVASLKGLRCLLGCVSGVEESDRRHIKENLKPLIETILLKCADGNRRVSQLSVSALMELSKGQNGELATARELEEQDTTGLEALHFVLKCILDMRHVSHLPWQHILGRLNVLEKLVETFSSDIIPSTTQELDSTHEPLTAVVKFVLSAVTNTHIKVSKVSKRIFAHLCKSIVQMPRVYEDILEIVLRLEPDAARRMERRMQRTLDEYESCRNVEEYDDDETSVTESETTPPPTPKRTAGSPHKEKVSRHTSRPHIDMAHVSPSKSRSRKKESNVSNKQDLELGTRGATNDESSDLSSISPISPRGEPISFKSEVTTPSISPQRGGPFADKTSNVVNCKEQIEMEEAEAIAVAMETSLVQNPLPVVPGLTPQKGTDVIVHVQSENGEDTPDGMCYLEGEHWVKGALLGTGAFSSCYQARDIRTGALMALKQVSFYRNTSKDQEKVTSCLMREIKLLVELDHPNIVRLLGATQHNGHFNLFVEWMAGGSVATLLSSYGAFEESVIVSYLRQLLIGVGFLHEKQVIHRDLKGANLLLDSTGQQLRIADFGTAATMASRVTGSSEFKGQLIGTIAFMAPEVLRGATYGRSCDIWSIGCCLIEMATGEAPWNASIISNHLQLIFKIASTQGPPPIPESLSPGMRDLTLRCLESNAENREPASELLKHAVFTRL
ncbi:mitogen-activated protein kinase kinase kinase 1-like isoform X2 [Amphiura filiformis]|uniref:mitogen-activated protein kinase kinase kinase 1-like isoform X2 n=1 Tax=Amphiura filiformis TaxID=82378 RepID=UPI003B228877